MHSCSKAELRNFKRRAGRKQPLEYVEMLWGVKTGRNYDIQLILPIPHKGSGHQCSIDNAIYEEHVETKAAETGLTFFGTIHTHNGAIHYEEPSAGDNVGAVRDGECIFAIDTITRLASGRLKHSVKFWYPQVPISNLEIG